MSEAEKTKELLDGLTDDELLALHREVCRRAAAIYGVRYRQVQQSNYRAAMAIRDTRFQPGLTAIENMNRSHALGRARPA